jgi:hypothetical protein
VSTQRIAGRLCVLHTRVWRTLHAESMYPYRVQRVQHLVPERLEFCKWLNSSRESHRFTDELQFNHDGVNNRQTLMCGQMRIPRPLWNSTFNNVLLSMDGEHSWIIS